MATLNASSLALTGSLPTHPALYQPTEPPLATGEGMWDDE